MQDTSISDSYHHSLPELASAALITAFFGFLWGAVAGAWSTIFREHSNWLHLFLRLLGRSIAHQLIPGWIAEANQMAGQVR